jgi:ketosteroid isomerase-like protein
VYPSVPVDRERGFLRNTQGACSEFSESPVGGVNVLSVEGQEAEASTRTQTSCKQKAGGKTDVRGPFRVFFVLRKTASGGWQITSVNRPDQTR